MYFFYNHSGLHRGRGEEVFCPWSCWPERTLSSWELGHSYTVLWQWPSGGGGLWVGTSNGSSYKTLEGSRRRVTRKVLGNKPQGDFTGIFWSCPQARHMRKRNVIIVCESMKRGNEWHEIAALSFFFLLDRKKWGFMHFIQQIFIECQLWAGPCT